MWLRSYSTSRLVTPLYLRSPTGTPISIQKMEAWWRDRRSLSRMAPSSMSQQLINLSPDLKRLRDEGYNIQIRSGYLVLTEIPYVNSQREIKRGALVSDLALAGDRTARPADHVARFAGEHPCNSDGSEIAQIKHGSAPQAVDDQITTQHSFSS